MILYREGQIFHLEGVIGGDYTLCGVAPEGENGDSTMERISDSGGRQVNCAQCARIIEHCWKLRKAKLAPIAMPADRRSHG